MEKRRQFNEEKIVAFANLLMKRKFIPSPPFKEWPPITKSGFSKQFSLRIFPKVNSIVHHHPDELVEIIFYLIEIGGEKVKDKIIKLLISFLPHGILLTSLDCFIATTSAEIKYIKCLVTNVDDIKKAHPFDLFQIITFLIDDVEFPSISNDFFSKKIKSITARQSCIRAAICKRSI